jgi:hypothetical protein
MMVDTTTPDENPSLKDQLAEEAGSKTKELLSKIKSAIQLWTHKNEGKSPEIEDLLEMLKPNDPNQIDPNDPRILYFKIYFGRNSENPLYYFDPTTNGWFDTNARQWSENKPPIADHLNERDIGTTDVFDAILHGVVDDQDYEELHKMNLIDDRSKQLWTKLNSLYSQTQAMQKSLEEKADPEKKPENPKSAADGAKPVNEASSGSNPYKEILKGAGVTEADFMQDPPQEPGQNMVEQINQVAMAPATNSQQQQSGQPTQNIDYEEIRKMIRAEIQHALGMSSEEQPQAPQQKGNVSFINQLPVRFKSTISNFARQRLNHSAENLISSIQIDLKEDLLVVAIDPENWLAGAVEEGKERWEMATSQSHLKGNTKMGRNGRYKIIPLRLWTTSPLAKTKTGMDYFDKVKAILKKPKFGNRKWTNQTKEGAFTVRREVLHDDPDLQGMFNVREYESQEAFLLGAKPKQSQYILFRTMSEKFSATKWVHPGIKPAHILKDSLKLIENEIEQDWEKTVNAELQKKGFV